VIKNLRVAGAAVDWWDYVSFRLLEVDVALEPPLLQALLDFALAARLPEFIALVMELDDRGKNAQVLKTSGRPAPSERRERETRRVAKHAARSELLRYGDSQRRWYFGRLELHPVKLNLTFRANNHWGESGSLPIPNIDGAPLCLSALIREHLYGTADDLLVAIGKHYLLALLRQVYRVVLRVELVDAPVGFVRTLGGGVKDLFYLPAKAVVRSSPSAFGRAVAAGGASFARGVMLAPVRPVGKFSGSLGLRLEGALVAMAMSHTGGGSALHAPTGGRMIRQGAAGLGLGVLRGATGLVYEPLKGARQKGARGFAVGVGKGIAGAALRPTAGLLRLADRWAGAWGVLTHSLTGDAEGVAAVVGGRIGRVRPPRMLHEGEQRLAEFSMAEALARHVLTSTEDGRYLGEPLLHCTLLIEVIEDGGRGRSSDAVVVVLTGMRLLTVDSSTWRVQLNVPLRKLQAVGLQGPPISQASPPPPFSSSATSLPSQRGSKGEGAAHPAPTTEHVIYLQLKPRKGKGENAPPPSMALAAASEIRRLPCYAEEAATILHEQLQAALASLNARRRIWHSEREPARRISRDGAATARAAADEYRSIDEYS
jgi:hypothetical protein